jgi:hypothetical protein
MRSDAPSISARSYTSAANSLRVAESNGVDPRTHLRGASERWAGHYGREESHTCTPLCEVFHTRGKKDSRAIEMLRSRKFLCV